MKTSVCGVQLVQKCEISISLENEEEVRAFINILNEASNHFENFLPKETKQYLLEYQIIDEIEEQIRNKFREA